MLQFSLSKFKPILVSMICWVTFALSANADSPLTSTDLATPYQDLEIIITAKNSKRLEGKVLDFLLSNAPLDQKAAVINALGWKFDGQNNGYLFLVGLAQSKGMKIDDLSLTDLSADHKFVLGYLLAMDDYFNLSPLRHNASQSLWSATPIQLLSQASFALPDNFTVHFVKSLVEAQDNMDQSWCAVYQGPQAILNQFPPNKRNLRPQAVENAMNYLNLYADDCGKSSNNANLAQNNPELNQIYQITAFNGNIVTATQGGIVIWDDNSRKAISIKEDSLCSNMITWRGMLWVGCQYRLWRYDGKQWKSYLHNPQYSENSNQLLVNPQDDLLVTYQGKLLRYDPQLDNFVPDAKLSTIQTGYDLIYRQNGELWQINFLDSITANSRRFPINSQSYPGSDPRRFYEDNLGNLWVTDFADGFYRYDDNKQEFIRFPDIANQGSDLIIDSQNNIIYLLHYREGLYIKKPNQKIEFINLGFLEYMRDLYIDQNGNIWVAGWNQLLKLTPTKNGWDQLSFKLIDNL
jgi:hypothetical protein